MWGALPAVMLLALAACGSADSSKAKTSPLVHVTQPLRHTFVDRIAAVGTAKANEQVTLASPVTERIERVNFADGQFVARGQVIAVLAQNRQRADLAGARARAVNARQEMDRLQVLKAHGFVTRATVDAQIAAVASAQAAVEAAQAMIDDRVVRAPFSGVASLRAISAGAVVNQGTPIATISDASRIKLDFTVPETQLGAVRPGVAVTARAAAFPERNFAGTIDAIDAVIDPNTRALMVRAVLRNPDSALKPGMLLNVTVEGARRQSLAIPALAVVGEGEDQYVFIVDAQGKAVRQGIRTGARDGDLVEILSGLNGSEQVIDRGVVKVAEGVKVRTGAADTGR
ncbi:MAG: efflux RND transporter periplasmic adaptor subunit [Proteobacteria bacterium]|nr:efflux RND transporter periplasmic adaptor subunit [Pseudomonadota bacterium]